MKYALKTFHPYPIITKKPILLCVDEILIDNKYINNKGKTEEFEHGTYDICEIKTGTPLWMSVAPNGLASIHQTDTDHLCILSDAKLGTDFDWDNSKQNLLPKRHITKAPKPRTP